MKTTAPNISSTTFSSNGSWDDSNELALLGTYTSVFVTILVFTALVAMIVNVLVFTSIHWIRKPMTPILKISISLAAADAFSSSLFASALFISTYLPAVEINVDKRFQIIMEMTKLSGILVTVTHLLALSFNHYIGILKPLQYNFIVTRRKVNGIIILLWILPTAYVAFLFISQADQQYWEENVILELNTTNNRTFFDGFKFRMSYSAYFLISICLMAVCYVHILVIVRRQQNVWKNLSRVGSIKWTARLVKNGTSTKACREKKQLEGNIRAIYTTLLILGSCVIGWMPALLIFVLMCKEDCYINGSELEYLTNNYLIQLMIVRLLENMLVVLKMLANPIIYSIRMKEIQEGTKHMQSALMSFFCPTRSDSSNYTLASRQSTTACNSSLRARMTTSIHGRTNHTTGRIEFDTTLL